MQKIWLERWNRIQVPFQTISKNICFSFLHRLHLVQILGAEKVEFVALEGEEAAKAFQAIKDDREALFKKLKDRKGGKGGKGPMKKRAPKNKKITFDDDEPADKKVKGTRSKIFL